MGYGQAEQSHKKRKGKAVARDGAGADSDDAAEEQVPQKVLFKRGERVAIGASGGKGELAYHIFHAIGRGTPKNARSVSDPEQRWR